MKNWNTEIDYLFIGLFIEKENTYQKLTCTHYLNFEETYLTGAIRYFKVNSLVSIFYNFPEEYRRLFVVFHITEWKNA